MQGPKLGDRLATSWGDYLQKNLLEALAIPRKEKRRRTEMGRIRSRCQGWTGWMTAAKNVGMWHRGVERVRKHSITPGDARISANPTFGAGYVWNFVLFFLFAVVSIILRSYIFFLRYSMCESAVGPPAAAPVLFWTANPSRCFSLICLYISLFYFV